MRTFRILLLIMGCYLAGWITADLLVPVVLAGRGEEPRARHGEAVVQVDQQASEPHRETRSAQP